MTSVPQGTGSAVGRRGLRRPTGRSLFLAVLLLVEAVYFQLAFDLEWMTVAGRIGPGFFPRIIGGLAVLLTLVLLVLSLRPGAQDAEGEDAASPDAALDAADEDGERAPVAQRNHPLPVVLLVAASAALLVVFLTLGAIVASTLYLLGMLFFLNRGRPVLNVLVALALPLALYLLFQTFLNAGLPGGVLPRF